jgi:HSP20 family molecular chaperone IbpA
MTLRETRDTYLVIAEFPGFIKDDIQIHLHNGVLNIYASSYLGSRHFHEKRKIHRMVALRRAVEEKQMRSLYEKNILKIWIPKKKLPLVRGTAFGLLRFRVLRNLLRKK